MAVVNPQPWPPDMTAKFGDDLFVVIKALRSAPSVEVAINYLAPYGLTQDEMALALQKVSPDMRMPKRMPASVTSSKANFYAAAWQVGAAYRQVGRILGITHQTVYTLARRVLGNTPTRERNKITDEQCEALVHEWRRVPSRSKEDLVTAFNEIIESWTE